ncbi:DUF6541 family protein [Nanoarchaeota archaeon]
MLIQVLYFLILTWSLGFSAMFFVKRQPKNFWERNLMNIGIGLGVLPILGILLNHLSILLHWALFLFLSLILPVFALVMAVIKKKSFHLDPKAFKLTKANLFIIIVIIMSASLFAVYHKGAFTYPYLEDDDPWYHAAGSKFIKETMSMSYSPEVDKSNFNFYLAPYPPAYDLMMGLLYQVGDNIMWTLKFFNALLIALLGVFFYFFTQYFLGNKKKALFATFAIIVIPSFLSHFIWASTLTFVLFFPSLYCAERLKKDWRYIIPGAFCIGGLLVSQPSNAFIFGIFYGVYFVIRSVCERKFNKNIFYLGLSGLLIALAVFWIPLIFQFGFERAMPFDINNPSTIEGIGGSEIYTFNDFMIAPLNNKINNPVGIGVFLFWLMLLSVVLILYKFIREPKKILTLKNSWKITSLIWLLIAFLGIHGNHLPFPVPMPHRWWAVFSIITAIIVVESVFDLCNSVKRFKIPAAVVCIALIIGILWTSAYPKYVVETAMWPPGINWGSNEEVSGYLGLTQLPYDTKIFPLCSDEMKVLAFDKLAEPWDPEYHRFKQSAMNTSATEIHSWLASHGYQYMIVDSYCVKEFGVNASNQKMQDIQVSQLFTNMGGNNAFFLLRV